MSQHDYLFSGADLGQAISYQQRKLQERADALSKQLILTTPTEDLCDRLEEEFLIEVPTLLDDQIHLDSGEAQIDVSQDGMRDIRNRSQPYYLAGSFVEVIAPFEGDAEIFRLRTSTFSSMPPRGKVQGFELRLRFDQLDHDADKLKREINEWLSNVRKYLSWAQNQLDGFNGSIRGIARQVIEERKTRLLKDDEMVSSLGFPLRKREDAPKTYALPVKRKKPVIRRPTATEAPFAPEPELANAQYEEILSIVQNMVEVMERSPHAFQTMGEEDLRQHFLVQLNGQFEGQATGETFNFNGKTDILIRQDGKNVFIAECKFWTGPKGFSETINQLLGYTAWRDTKTAILVFNRGRQLSTVLEKVPGVVEEHPNYKRTLGYASETGFRFILHQDGDENRDIILTVLVFDVPTE